MSERFSAGRIAEAVNGGMRTAVEVASDTLDRIAAYDAVQPQIWIARLPREAVLERARAVDARIAAGERLSLAGVTFAIKDNIDLAGAETTAACPGYAYAPGRDAEVVSRLLEAGAIPVGKTNLDQFATGLVGARSPYGAPGCVFNRAYVSGGSSSGSAVAVAAGLVPFALGTDTAGSGRVPAAFNGLVGFKPTKGRWSTRGVVPACRSLDCVTVLTNDLADAELLDGLLTGLDTEDAFSRRPPTAAPAPEGSRLGVPRPADLDWFGDTEAEHLFEQAKAAARDAGLTLVEIDIAPLLECARLLYQGPWVAERAAAVAGLLKSRPGAIHPVVRTILQGGALTSAVETFDGFYALKTFEAYAEEMWGLIDALMLPTTPTIYRIAEVMAEPFGLNANLGLYTNFVNLLDMAAIAIPAGYRQNATGFGVSLIGPAWSEARLLKVSSGLATVAGEAPPLDLEPRSQRIKLAVVGAHLAGMPLHWQLTSRDARFMSATQTVPTYRLYAMAGSKPPKPALVHDAQGGRAIEVEVYELDAEAFGSFTADVPAPLAIGSVTLASGETVKGFVAEPRAILGAAEITWLGGWRAYIATLKS